VNIPRKNADVGIIDCPNTVLWDAVPCSLVEMY